jgi:hypothetical protein
MNSSKSLEQTITDLKLAIDQIDSGFKNTRNLILELARVLDESGQCERRGISRKIKELLDIMFFSVVNTREVNNNFFESYDIRTM